MKIKNATIYPATKMKRPTILPHIKIISEKIYNANRTIYAIVSYFNFVFLKDLIKYRSFCERCQVLFDQV